MNIEKIVGRINKSLSKDEFIIVLCYLKDKNTIKFINNFLDKKSSSITKNELDLIHDLIVAAKTIYEIDRYCDPYDDELYDRMLSKFKKFRDEPFGKSQAGVATAVYKYDVLSGTLDKTHFIYSDSKPDRDDRLSLEEWFNSLPIDNDDILHILVNEKKDGTSVTIDYEYDGDTGYYAASAISRGKKDYGEGTDCTKMMPNKRFDGRAIKSVLGYYPKYIGVQYEFLISNEDMKKFEKYLGQSFSNNRSAAAGLLRRILFASSSERERLKEFMSLVPVGFDILDAYQKNKAIVYYADMYEAVTKSFIYGNISMKYDTISGTKAEILKTFASIVDDVISARSKLNHAIDGLVLTILDNNLVKKLGRRNNINKFQVAYKFPETGKKTIVRDMIITTGNFGYKEILLKVDPVVLNGTVQNKAQIHSLKKFFKMKPRIGDEIILKLSGDVIPFGFKDETCKSGSGDKLKLPEYCDCGTALIEEKNKLRCPNKKCPHRVIGLLTTFFVELNAKGIGEKTCSQLYHELGITKPSQILKMSKNDFKKLNGFKDASAELAYETIANILAKPQTIAAIVSSLGIDGLRSSKAQKIFSHISVKELYEIVTNGDIQKLTKLISDIDGFDKTAKSIAIGLVESIDELTDLLELIPVRKEKTFEKEILISGFRNDELFEEVANRAGYKVVDHGSPKDLVVVKDISSNSTKVRKAIAHGIPVLTRDEFIKKFNVL